MSCYTHLKATFLGGVKMAKKGNVTHLDNDYTRQVAAAHTETKQLLTKRRRKRAVIMVAFFIVVFLGLGAQIIHTKIAMGETTQQISNRKTRLTATKKTSSHLQEHVELLNNKSYLEKLIRSKYYYSKSGETIYSLPTDKASDVTAK